MRKLLLALLALAPAATHAQSVPNGPILSGQVWTPAQWNNAWQSKQDLGGSLASATSPVDALGLTLPIPVIADRVVSRVSVLEKGAKCDGATDDSPAFTAAIAAAGLAPGGGHVVEVPATGHSCALKTGLVLGNGVSLEGVAGMHWPTYNDNAEADWTAAGSWLRCDDTANACITMAGNGSHVSGINVWYTQPTPPGASCGATCIFAHNWTPTDYPWTIRIIPATNTTPGQAFDWLSDITVVNGSKCLDFEGPSSGVGSFYTHIDHVHFGCFNTVANFVNVDNTLSIHDWRDQVLWFQANPSVWGWMEGDIAHPGHKVGWNMSYVSGLQADHVEYYQDATAIQASNGDVTSGLGSVAFAVQAGQWTGLSFNQVCRVVYVDPSVNNFNVRLTNVVMNIDPQTSVVAGQCAQATPYAFDLQSDGVDVGVTDLNGFTAQTIAAVGGGKGGKFALSGASRSSYGAYSPGAPAFLVNAGAALDMDHGLNAIFPGPNAGPKIQGAPNWPVMPAGDLWLSANPGEARNLYFVRNDLAGGAAARWGWVLDNTAETGGNAGGNLRLDAKSDAGANIFSPIGITRATGLVNINNGAVVAGGLQVPNGARVVLPTSCSGQATGTLFTVPQSGQSYALVGVCP